jgi:hypothetical protein
MLTFVFYTFCLKKIDKMKTKLILLVLIPFIFGINLAKSQGFTPPSPGKAVLYFVPENKKGTASFEYFHNDKYIGVFKGKNYMRYECDPGQNLFWISTENKEFITADLHEGGTYIVIVCMEFGWARVRVSAYPLSSNSKEEFERVKKLIKSKAPVVTPEAKIQEMNIKLSDFIKEKLAMYENEWKQTKDFSHIKPEMAIPIEMLK